MKLDRLHESVLITVVLVVSLSLAVAMGGLVGQGNMAMVGMFLVFVILAGLFLALRERMWLLIPAAWMLGGQVTVLPLPFSVSHLAVFYAFAGFLLLKAFKVVRLKPKLSFVDIWMLVVLVYLATVFLRNPVGMEALGSDRVGGRPYFNVAVACAAYWVLARVIATPFQAFVLPLLVVAGHAFQTVLNVVADRFPSTVHPISQLYSGIAAAETQEFAVVQVDGPTRLAYWQGIATTAMLTACSFWRPFTLINPLYFWRFALLVFSLVAVFLSGFRSAFIAMAMYFFIGSYFRRGWPEVGKGLVLGAAALALLLVTHGRLFELPFGAQRALSFLPGKWDYAAQTDARGSTDWRVTMWKAMLSGNRYIANKWLGDGFGFTRQQLQIMHANARFGGTADQHENLLISGGVHSGPITAVRYVGYFGLLLFLILVGLVAVKAFRLVRQAQGTPFYFLALFIGIPNIWFPFHFVFIFGAYESDLPNVIFSIGMLKMLENSLAAHNARAPEASVPVNPIREFRRPRQFAPAGRVR